MSFVFLVIRIGLIAYLSLSIYQTMPEEVWKRDSNTVVSVGFAFGLLHWIAAQLTEGEWQRGFIVFSIILTMLSALLFILANNFKSVNGKMNFNVITGLMLSEIALFMTSSAVKLINDQDAVIVAAVGDGLFTVNSIILIIMAALYLYQHRN